MDENNEQPVKRKRGRPKGIPRSPNSGRKKVPRADEVLKQSGGVEILPPSRSAAPLDLSKVIPPTAVVPVPDDPGAVPNMIRAVLAIRQTVDLDNPATLYNAMEQYLNLCSATGMKITNQTMYMAVGVGRTEMHYWDTGQRRQNNPAYREFARLCKDICAAAREQYGIEGQVNPILTIFHQKWFDGYSDAPQQEEVKDPLGEIQDPAKLAEKYKDIITD